MTTLADVAAAAGVSKAAASLVLSGKFEGRVSERKAERVRMAADELGYVRDAIAGGMRNGRTRTIGVIGERVLSTPYAVSMIDAVLSTSQSLGWSVLLTDAGHDGVAAKEAVREMVARRVGQVVIASMYHRVVPVPGQIKDVVVLNGVADRPGVPGVVPDERQGASDAVAHLVGLGHRRIGYLGHDDAESIAVRERSDSYRHSLQEAGLSVDESLLVTGDLDPDSVDATARRLLDRSDRPTAVFCYNDALAAGVFRQAARLGISIPDDLSVIGFDDLALISVQALQERALYEPRSQAHHDAPAALGDGRVAHSRARRGPYSRAPGCHSLPLPSHRASLHGASHHLAAVARAPRTRPAPPALRPMGGVRSPPLTLIHKGVPS